MAIAVGRLISRYCLVTLLPAFVVSTIYADWSHTQKFKAKQLQLNKKKNDGDLFDYS